MSWETVEGPEKVKNFLQNVIKVDRVAHAYLFTGSEIAKREMAIQFAKALNCPEIQFDSCDSCPVCRQIEHGNSPEVFELFPDGNSIKIDQVRAIQRQFAYTPRPDAMRILIIRQAELLTQQAANSLLKFLEEPQSPMVAILFAANERSVLQTIRSRCQIILFSDPPLEQRRKNWMEEKGYPDWLASICTQIPYLENSTDEIAQEEFAQMIGQVIEWNKEILAGRTEALLFIYQEPFGSIIQNGQAALLLDILILWQNELLHCISSSRKEPCLFSPWSKELSKQAYLKDITGLLTVMERVMQARHNLRKPMQDQAILEQMVLTVQEG